MPLRVLLFASLLIAGCTNQPVQFTPLENDASHARITIYRPHNLANILVEPQLLHNNQALVKLGNKQHISVLTDTGTQQFSLELPERYTGHRSVTLNVEPPQDYFLRLTTRLQFQKNRPYIREFFLQSVDKQTALTELPATRALHINPEKPAELPQDKDNAPASRFSIQKTQNPFSR